MKRAILVAAVLVAAGCGGTSGDAPVDLGPCGAVNSGEHQCAGALIMSCAFDEGLGWKEFRDCSSYGSNCVCDETGGCMLAGSAGVRCPMAPAM